MSETTPCWGVRELGRTCQEFGGGKWSGTAGKYPRERAALCRQARLKSHRRAGTGARPDTSWRHRSARRRTNSLGRRVPGPAAPVGFRIGNSRRGAHGGSGRRLRYAMRQSGFHIYISELVIVDVSAGMQSELLVGVLPSYSIGRDHRRANPQKRGRLVTRRAERFPGVAREPLSQSFTRLCVTQHGGKLHQIYSHHH